MSVSSPEVSLSSSSTSSKDDVDYWELNPQPLVSDISSMDCWDYAIEFDCLKGPEDLQLAAELGKTLLERNKELESTIKQQQIAIDDQSQEIEYLTKQNNALREVNDTRLKIYENIEISIQDLEKQNHRLTVESNNLKKTNKTLCHTNESLEEKYEELRKQIDELHRELEIERRKNERLQMEQRTRREEQNSIAKDNSKSVQLNIQNANDTNVLSERSKELNSNINADNTPLFHQPIYTTLHEDCVAASIDEVDRKFAETCDNEDILNIITELNDTKRQLRDERQRGTELEDQLSSLIQDNRELQNRLAQSAVAEVGEMRSMHDELSILEESGQGKMCRRCLRSVDDDTLTVPDYASSIACTEDGDDISLNEMMCHAQSTQNIYQSTSAAANQTPLSDSTLSVSAAPSPNLYRDLVEKYEALLEVHNGAFKRNRTDEVTASTNAPDETAAADYKAKETIEPESVRVKEITVATGAKRKICLRTPTDFSEAETSSSGFSDEISNKCTQTEETFLCTIADGDDKFSIYDETSPIDSRFRHCPKYRHLFKEIFATLKKAAENKDEGERLPLLDDTNPAFKVPPVTPAVEELPNFPDETESVVSSVVSEQSIAMSECVTKRERKTAKKNLEKAGQENKPPTNKEIVENGRILTPFKREPLEYLAINNIRKKNKRRGKHQPADPSDSPVLPSTPRFFYESARKRRQRQPVQISRATTSTSITNATTTAAVEDSIWNGNSMTVYNRNIQSPTPKGHKDGVHRTKSTASHDLHKLMKLDLSYAEVLRRADQCKHHRRK